MKLTGKLKTQADYAAMKEEKKEIDKKASIRLTDDELDNLRFWAKQNPPDGCRVILAGIAKPKSKSASGTEDFVLTLRVEEL